MPSHSQGHDHIELGYKLKFNGCHDYSTPSGGWLKRTIRCSHSIVQVWEKCVVSVLPVRTRHARRRNAGINSVQVHSSSASTLFPATENAGHDSKAEEEVACVNGLQYPFGSYCTSNLIKVVAFARFVRYLQYGRIVYDDLSQWHSSCLNCTGLRRGASLITPTTAKSSCILPSVLRSALFVFALGGTELARLLHEASFTRYRSFSVQQH